MAKLAKHDHCLNIGCHKNFAMRYGIVRDNPVFLSVARGFRLPHGKVRTDGKVTVNGSETGVVRWHTPGRDVLIIYAGPRPAKNAAKAIARAKAECVRAAEKIAQQQDMILGEPEVLDAGTITFHGQWAR